MTAEPLSPVDAATLWPQLRRLDTEVIATRAGENLLLSSGMAAMGITRLPRVPRTAVVGVKRGLSYRGVLVARELAGGAGWEVVSLRLAREKDDDTVTALLGGAAQEAGQRGGRMMLARYPDGSPHGEAIRRSGLMRYRLEQLFAIPLSTRSGETRFRPASRSDRHGVFRLYCRAVPEHIRRHEAPTQQEWRAILDSYDCEHEHVLEYEGNVVGWVGLGERECRILDAGGHEGTSDAALDLIETQGPRNGTLVLHEDQEALSRTALARGYEPLGVRVVCVRRVAVLNPIKEVAAVPAESLALPH
jgi:hypothetical protein